MEQQEDDDLNDALDQLLKHAHASLRRLDSIRAKLPPRFPGQGGQVRRDSKDVSAYWQPRCNAYRWAGNGPWPPPDIRSQLDSEDTVTSLGSDSESEDEDDGDWDFLHAAYGGVSAPSQGRRVRNSPMSRSRSGMGDGCAASGASDKPHGGNRPQKSVHAEAKDKSSSQDSQHCSARADRGQRAGFRFGGRASTGSGDCPVDGEKASTDRCPETQIVATLTAARASGTGAARKELKRLLLRWHPDKCPQDESSESAALRAEATRVLRFILLERERLGV